MKISLRFWCLQSLILSLTNYQSRNGIFSSSFRLIKMKGAKGTLITNFFSSSETISGKKRKNDEITTVPTPISSKVHQTESVEGEPIFSKISDSPETTENQSITTETLTTTTLSATATTTLPSSENYLPGTESVIDSSIPEIIPTGWMPMDTLEPSWRSRLLPEFSKPYFQHLLQFLSNEVKINKKIIFPPSEEVFTALNYCSFDNVKVVIIGQDPYHGPGQAHGLAFSVKHGVTLPPSLKNMIQEAHQDPAIQLTIPKHGNLLAWSTQGILLLNTVLTVEKGAANSHQKKGSVIYIITIIIIIIII
jgi:uracil-DNA glycosylase